MNPQVHTNAASKRGPIAQTFNGRGSKPWLPEATADPGWVSWVAPPPTQAWRTVCWRCELQLGEHSEGRNHVRWDNEPPDHSARCPRCERTFGERPPE